MKPAPSYSCKTPASSKSKSKTIKNFLFRSSSKKCASSSAKKRKQKKSAVKDTTMSHQTQQSTNNSLLSQVHVGVRVRPLSKTELNQGGSLALTACPQNQTIQLNGKTFTYDAVFDSKVSQIGLYKKVSGTLLHSFVDGYNSTIIAYGQTGSGKTFTMGSEVSQHNLEAEEVLGLIPRFLSDIYLSLEEKRISSTEYKVETSFLEVYGEDIFDLLDDKTEEKRSLPLREDTKGKVSVVGLNAVEVSNARDALDVLHKGTNHRTTAATLMNHTSSRSHAVFTIHLHKIEQTSGGAESLCTTSTFTFVDLAGSERMKRTGAQGERAREGIEINKGLLALGNVINALADENQLKKGKKVFVPYRQSKLTRLLQDALGGNSQTLFLACVSPSNVNASETLSTLQYANRARNIQNLPTKNIDPTAQELQRLQKLNSVLQCHLIRQKFDDACPTPENVHAYNEASLKRTEVQDYLNRMYKLAESSPRGETNVSSYSSGICSIDIQPTSGTTIDIQPTSGTTPLSITQQQQPLSPSENDLLQPKSLLTKFQSSRLSTTTEESLGSSPKGTQDTESLDESEDSFSSESTNPAQGLVILNQLLKLQQCDEEYDEEQEMHQKELDHIQKELIDNEYVLQKLRDNLNIINTKNAALMQDLLSLEREKTFLEEELHRIQNSQGSEVIQRKLKDVEANLKKAKEDAKKYEVLAKKAKQEANKCSLLEHKIYELKQSKVNLMKSQRENAAKHRQFMEAKRKEIQTLKKKERKTDLKLSKLETECQHQKKNLEKRKDYCNKLSKKLKHTESLLTKALEEKKKDHQLRFKRFKGHNREEIDSLKIMVRKMIADKVHESKLKQLYDEKVVCYGEHMQSLATEVKKYNSESEEPADGGNVETIQNLEQTLEGLGEEIKELRRKLRGDDSQKEINTTTHLKESILNLNQQTSHKLLFELFDEFTSIELKRRQLEEKLQIKEKANSQEQKIPVSRDHGERRHTPTTDECDLGQQETDDNSCNKRHCGEEKLRTEEKANSQEQKNPVSRDHGERRHTPTTDECDLGQQETDDNSCNKRHCGEEKLQTEEKANSQEQKIPVSRDHGKRRHTPTMDECDLGQQETDDNSCYKRHCGEEKMQTEEKANSQKEEIPASRDHGKRRHTPTTDECDRGQQETDDNSCYKRHCGEEKLQTEEKVNSQEEEIPASRDHGKRRDTLRTDECDLGQQETDDNRGHKRLCGSRSDDDAAENGNTSDDTHDYSEMKVSQLKNLLKERGLKVSGNKRELIRRLEAPKASDVSRKSEVHDLNPTRRTTRRRITVASPSITRSQVDSNKENENLSIIDKPKGQRNPFQPIDPNDLKTKNEENEKSILRPQQPQSAIKKPRRGVDRRKNLAESLKATLLETEMML